MEKGWKEKLRDTKNLPEAFQIAKRAFEEGFRERLVSNVIDEALVSTDKKLKIDAEKFMDEMMGHPV